MTGPVRTLTQDIAFAVDQLVEIAIRALSPAVNDTFTALTCIDWLADGLCQVELRWNPTRVHRDNHGYVRVVTSHISHRRLVQRAYEKIRQAGRGMPAVMIRQLDGLARIMALTPPRAPHGAHRAGGHDPARGAGDGSGGRRPSGRAEGLRRAARGGARVSGSTPRIRAKGDGGILAGTDGHQWPAHGVPRHGAGRRQDLPDARGGPRGAGPRARRRRSAISSRTGAPRRSRRPRGWRSSRDDAIEYRGATLEEMDLPGILRRRPELCLIDELAHANVPGTEHDQRHEDVDAVLDAGIDVYSTVNVQHVESLAGQVAALTGVQVERDAAGPRARRRRQRRARRHHAEAADRAPGGGEDLPRRLRRRRAEQLLPPGQAGDAARGLAAPRRRGGRARAQSHAAARHPTAAATSSSDARSGARARHARSRRRARRSITPITPRDASPRPSTSSGSPPAARRPLARTTATSPRSSGSSRRSAARCSSGTVAISSRPSRRWPPSAARPTS